MKNVTKLNNIPLPQFGKAATIQRAVPAATPLSSNSSSWNVDDKKNVVAIVLRDIYDIAFVLDNLADDLLTLFNSNKDVNLFFLAVPNASQIFS